MHDSPMHDSPMHDSPIRTAEDRIANLGKLATGFIYVVSQNGVTGQRATVNNALPAFLARIRAHTDLPLVVGFGISKREHVVDIGKIADGVVVGSAMIAAAESAGEGAGPDACAEKIKAVVASLTGGTVLADPEWTAAAAGKTGAAAVGDASSFADTSKEFMFGEFGGRFIPETLVAAHERLWEEWQATKDDPECVFPISLFSPPPGQAS